MSKILSILQSEHKSEHYVKKYKKPAIYPKVVTTKPASSFSESEKKEIMEKHKRWYVYYRYLKPESDPPEYVKQTHIYFNINRDYKDFNEKLKAIKALRNSVENLLKKGFSPYEKDSSDVLHKTDYALDYALNIKKKELKPTTYKDYETKIGIFKKYLKKQDVKYSAIEYVDKKIVVEFLNQIPGAKNSNNTRAILSSIFTILSESDYVKTNFVKELRTKKITEKPVKIYEQKDIEKITSILEQQDPTLLMFIKFISYMFWRPVEILRIKVEDIDFNKRTIRTETKTKSSKIKIIPEIIINDIKEYAKGKSGYLFKPDNFIEWDLAENDKRVYFTRRFSRFRERNNIDEGFKMYSFRHTFITKLYLEFRKELSKEESIKKLSLITGHESRAIFNYIQVNDVELPEDYSEYLK